MPFVHVYSANTNGTGYLQQNLLTSAGKEKGLGWARRGLIRALQRLGADVHELLVGANPLCADLLGFDDEYNFSIRMDFGSGQKI